MNGTVSIIAQKDGNSIYGSFDKFYCETSKQLKEFSSITLWEAIAIIAEPTEKRVKKVHLCLRMILFRWQSRKKYQHTSVLSYSEWKRM